MAINFSLGLIGGSAKILVEGAGQFGFFVGVAGAGVGGFTDGSRGEGLLGVGFAAQENCVL